MSLVNSCIERSVSPISGVVTACIKTIPMGVEVVKFPVCVMTVGI